MKKIYTLISSFLILACNTGPNDYLNFSGKIENFKENSAIEIQSKTGYKKLIKLKNDGSFQDSMNIEKGEYMMIYQNKFTAIHLENDKDLEVNLDFNDFDNSIHYSGKASKINNFYHQVNNITLKGLTANDLEKDNSDVGKKIDSLKNKLSNVLKSNTEISDSIGQNIKSNFDKNIAAFYKYKEKKDALKNAFPQGMDVVNFKYEDINGKKVALSDLRGKLTYIDIWATWCGPCKAEIPHLKSLEKSFHGKDVNFVSISVDPLSKKEKWTNFVQDKSLGGIQLFADNSFKSEFIKSFQINSIPRFILINKEGKLINANAPRPSNPATADLLKNNL